MKKLILAGFILPFLLSSCGETGKQIKKDLLPTAGGDYDQIILVMDSTQWKGKLGSELKSTFRAPVRGLPQDESAFILSRVNPRQFNSVLKTAVNLVFVMTLDSRTRESENVRRYFTNQSLKKIQADSSLWMTIRQDEFAKGQVALYLFGQDEESLARKLSENKKRLTDFFESLAQKRIKSKILGKREIEIEKAIAERQDIQLQVPYGWEVSKNLPNFTWLRFLEADKEQNLFIYQEPYRDVKIFDNIPSFRDKITETFLRDAEKPEIFITRQHIIPVFEDRVTFDGKFSVKARGLWKISDNSGGGPFVSYSLVDEQKQKVYYIEGYVYAPGTKKKNFVRELDAILSTFKTDAP